MRPARPLAVVATILIAALASALQACAPGDASTAGAAADTREAAGHTGHARHAAGLTAVEPTDLSLYNLDARWLDQAGAGRTLGSLAGRIQIVAMVYTNCSFACPRLLLDMKRIDGELGTEYDDRVGFVLVSIDPARDTPARLAEFAAGARLDPGRWTLLTPEGGDEGALLELAALLGVQYRHDGAGEFTHSNVLTVLDENGEILHRQEGLGADPAATLKALRTR